MPPEMRAEIAILAPATVGPNTITQDKLADQSVGTAQLQDQAVGAPELALGAVGAQQLALGAVGTNQLAAGAVTGPKTGAGVMKVNDSNGTPISITAVFLTASQYSALSAPDPNTLYLLTS